jgi:hypothetical protein
MGVGCALRGWGKARFGFKRFAANSVAARRNLVVFAGWESGGY